MADAIRATMRDLITDVRRLIGDPAGATAMFSDLDVQIALDHHREDVRLRAATVRPDYGEGGAVIWKRYYMEAGDWEADVLLQSVTFADVTSDGTLDYRVGRVLFTTSHVPPVYWSGQTYDVYAAGADLLDQRAVGTAGLVDFSEDGQAVRHSQQAPRWAAQAAALRAQARWVSAPLHRGDRR